MSFQAVRLTNHKDLCLVCSGLSKKLDGWKRQRQETQLRIRADQGKVDKPY